MKIRRWIAENIELLIFVFAIVAFISGIFMLYATLESPAEYKTTCYGGFSFVEYTPPNSFESDSQYRQLIGQDGKPVACVEKEGTK